MPTIPEGAQTFSLPSAGLDARTYVQAEISEQGLDTDARLLFGIKVIILLLHQVVAAYNRHRTNAVEGLPASVVEVLDFLSSIDTVLDLMNPPGPR